MEPREVPVILRTGEPGPGGPGSGGQGAGAPVRPGEHESERASNSYLMSLVALMAGLPLPIVNLIATTIFWFGNRRQPWFVRWHCTQALLSQMVFLVLNVAGVWWTWWIVFGEGKLSAGYLGYIVTLIIFNVAELGATIYAAVRTRRGHHVQWWFFGPLTDSLVPRDQV